VAYGTRVRYSWEDYATAGKPVFPLSAGGGGGGI
jgi:hypothetical protein